MAHNHWDLEEVYDTKISPLMTQILAICKEHRMPMTAVFQYCDTEDGGAGYCSSALPFEEKTNPDLIALMRQHPIQRKRHFALAETHITNPDGSKTITVRRVT